MFKEIEKRAVAKSYMTNGLLIQYMTKYLRMNFLTYEEDFLSMNKM